MKYPFIEETQQTIEYNVLHAIEAGKTQGIYVKMLLKTKGIDYSIEQIRGAMQRLKRSNLVKYDRCMWKLVDAA